MTTRQSPSHGTHKCVRYFLLLQWDPEYVVLSHVGRWTVEYGSYERRDCKDEREYYNLSANVPNRFLRIKEICSCEASLDDQLRIAAEEPRP